MIKNTTKRQKLGWVIFIFYLIFLAYFLFFSDYFGRGSHAQAEYAYNLTPFKEIRRFIVYRHVVGWESFLLNIVGNIVGFMPCGFFLPVISRRSRRWFNTVLLSFLFSLCIETIQLVFKVGSFDVDDMILNTLGGILGYILYKIIQHIRVRVRRKKRAKAETSVLH
ncbi:VanZ family protein [Lacrimispora saccharolytica]|uniref:VanZ family protein n=1 Tax=Lacrimispora saccharolytica (strain ATCC 35040 / DSM 2544 / NRCC 2533 / WM1) TaxID=610130 RepID=D9RAC2_LACSW|nr:VanZ family protein [Lacrimispora saccharolytica]ADL04200.1 VanZ family protein [[Clostridium] saccharolyticum WM1]QRV21516.1 VanZ family protein [Lacrimispora saccharolytica]